jgi:membrane fusion protein (multidrug efflux system)
VLRALLPVTLVLAVSSCSRRQGPASLPAPPVLVAAVRLTNALHSADFIGQLDSPRNVEVRARVEGFLEKVLFVEGTQVEEGATLFLLDPKPFEQKLSAARGSLAEAQAALNKYEKDVARLRPLATNKAIPQQDLDNALASVEIGQANVLSAEARVESARLDLGYCELKAPVTGLIGAQEVPVGSLVGRGQPTLLATISTLDPIWIYCAISEVDYLKAQRRAREHGRQLGELPVTLVLADDSELPQPGRWVFLDRAVDAATGTLRARAEFANPDKILRPGMFARARVKLRTASQEILVPQRAVQELQGLSFVWVVGPDDRVAQRKVTLGSRIGSDCIIEDGLESGERFVVEGLQKVRDGARVKPMTAAEMAQAAATSPTAPRSARKE